MAQVSVGDSGVQGRGIPSEASQLRSVRRWRRRPLAMASGGMLRPYVDSSSKIAVDGGGRVVYDTGAWRFI